MRFLVFYRLDSGVCFPESSDAETPEEAYEKFMAQRRSRWEQQKVNHIWVVPVDAITSYERKSDLVKVV